MSVLQLRHNHQSWATVGKSKVVDEDFKLQKSEVVDRIGYRGPVAIQRSLATSVLLPEWANAPLQQPPLATRQLL